VSGLVSQPAPDLGNYLLPVQFEQDTPFLFITCPKTALPVFCALLQWLLHFTAEVAAFKW